MNITGIILAGGSSRRFRQEGDYPHKSLVPIEGKSLLTRLHEHFAAAGISKVLTVTGEFHHALAADAAQPCHNPNWDTVNIMGSLLSIPYSEMGDEIIVSYSDVWYSRDLIEDLLATDHPAVIPSVNRWKQLWEMRFENPLNDLESFQYNPEFRLLEIGKKVSDMEQVMGQFAGVFRLSTANLKAAVQHLGRSRVTNMDVTTFFQHCLEAQLFPIRVMPSDAEWFEFDHQSDYILYQTNNTI